MSQMGGDGGSAELNQAELFDKIKQLQDLEEMRPLTDAETGQLNELRVQIAKLLEGGQE